MIPEKSEEKAGVRITVCPGVMVGSKFLNISLKVLLKWMHALTQPHLPTGRGSQVGFCSPLSYINAFLVS